MGADADQIFDFERDFAGSLRCIPMTVRLKLDLCGIKLSLRQWSRFDRTERAELVRRPCAAIAERRAYRRQLEVLIRDRTDEPVETLAVDADPPWADRTKVAVQVGAQARRKGLPPPNPAAWATLSDLERFALVKLARPGHDNDNFAAALREFGLT
jgi:hypothetical protein